MIIGIGLRLLETLTSALYEDPIVFFREYVQNSADAFIRSPSIQGRIDININEDDRTIEFFDNGYGIPTQDFKFKMCSIGVSEKGGAVDQIGFRGIGRLSAMPFCDKLVFTNKVAGSDVVQEFTWDGQKYNKLLSLSANDDLASAIDDITNNKTYSYNGAISDHFFKVRLVSYNDEIASLIQSPDFSIRLSKLLPLKYSQDFAWAETIHQRYSDFMGDSFEKYEFDVYLNGIPLFKPYVDSHILESDIVFWDLYFDNVAEDMPNEKIGVLWFTFNRRVNANPHKSPRGIYVRSKNMLLGTEYAIADAVTKGNNEYIATYRELTQTLNGVYGELLIDTTRLSDNARRDWFRIDASSNQLRQILTDYLKKLKAYRYAASQAFNDKQTEAKRKKVISAYQELTKGFDPAKFEQEFYADEPTPKQSIFYSYADDDIPRRPVAAKRLYEDMLQGLKTYCILFNGEDGFEDFIRLRTFIKQYLNDIDVQK